MVMLFINRQLDQTAAKRDWTVVAEPSDAAALFWSCLKGCVLVVPFGL